MHEPDSTVYRDCSCRACRPDDCFDEALSEVCLTSVACQQCVDVGMETPQGDSEGSALNMNPQANVYGCSEYSETPICDLGTCRGCANDDECETRPGSANICAFDAQLSPGPEGERGHCMLCEDSSDVEPDRGCEDRGRPHCFLRDGRGYCTECTADQHCRDGTCVFERPLPSLRPSNKRWM